MLLPEAFEDVAAGACGSPRLKQRQGGQEWIQQPGLAFDKGHRQRLGCFLEVGNTKFGIYCGCTEYLNFTTN
jgi:hypothetical protein